MTRTGPVLAVTCAPLTTLVQLASDVLLPMSVMDMEHATQPMLPVSVPTRIWVQTALPVNPATTIPTPTRAPSVLVRPLPRLSTVVETVSVMTRPTVSVCALLVTVVPPVLLPSLLV